MDIARDLEDFPMDILSSPLATASDGSSSSSYDDSTGPTTPASSPLFCSSKVEEDLSLSHLIHSPASYKLDTDTIDLNLDIPRTASLQSFPAWGPVRNVCVVGAGYVGRFLSYDAFAWLRWID